MNTSSNLAGGKGGLKTNTWPTSSHLAATEGGSAQDPAAPIAPAGCSQIFSQAPSVHGRQYGGRGTKNTEQLAGRSVFFGPRRFAQFFNCWRRLSVLAPLQGSCGEATERLVLSSTNPPTLPWMVQESWTRCLVRGTLQDCLVLSFLISSLLGKTKPITFPPTKASH